LRSLLVIHTYYTKEWALTGSTQSAAIALTTVIIMLSIFYIIRFNFTFNQV